MAKVRKSGIAVAITVLLAVAAAGYFFIDQASRDKARAAAASAAPPGIPVTVGIAQNKDMPVYVRGIGTVQAYKMVTIKSRVDGQIMKVAFEEGQEVKAGDPLFQIDPRPFQATLDQAIANKQRDEAQLVGAAGRPRALRQADRLGLPVAPELRPAEGDRRRAEGRDRRPTRPRSTPPSSTSAMPTSARRSTAAPARARSIPATSCRPARTPRWSPSPRSGRSSSTSPCRRTRPTRSAPTRPRLRSTVVAYGSDDKTELAEGKLTLIENQIDAATGTLQAQGHVREYRREAVAGRVRQRAAGAVDPQGRRHRAAARRDAGRQRLLRLRRARPTTRSSAAPSRWRPRRTASR